MFDTIEIEDMIYDKNKKMFIFDCPCGDKFRVGLQYILNLSKEDISEITIILFSKNKINI